MNPLLGYPPLNSAVVRPLAIRDRVRVPDRRIGEVIGFYRGEDDSVLVRLEDGERSRYTRGDVRLLID
jgi:hypothetical protein